jgi:hypothetical protein
VCSAAAKRAAVPALTGSDKIVGIRRGEKDTEPLANVLRMSRA